MSSATVKFCFELLREVSNTRTALQQGFEEDLEHRSIEADSTHVHPETFSDRDLFLNEAKTKERDEEDKRGYRLLDPFDAIGSNLEPNRSFLAIGTRTSQLEEEKVREGR